MPYTRTQIGNLALGMCGVFPNLDDVDLDQSNEAINIRLWFDQCVGILLETCSWDWATEQADLADLGTPPDDWDYRYLYPANFKRINKIVNPTFRTARLKEEKVPFRIRKRSDGYGKVILTDMIDAKIEGNVDMNDVSMFPSVFVEALMLAIASHIASPLRVDAKLAANISQQFQIWKNEAQLADKLERQDDPEADSQFVLAR
jgi:hypothetical protein